MGPNLFKNLTVVAVLAIVGALGYMIYKASPKKKAAVPTESNAGLSAYSDSTYSLSSPAAVGENSAAVGGANTYSEPTPARPVAKDIVAEDPTTSLVGSSGTSDDISSSQKSKTTKKSAATVKAKTAAPKTPAKFNAGSKGDFMVVAGSFASKDNAEGLVGKLKKLGFTGAEAVKMENSANVYVVAGYYPFKGGADAAVRTLKQNKMDAYTKKKMGDIYKPATAPAKPAATAKSVTPSKPL